MNGRQQIGIMRRSCKRYLFVLSLRKEDYRQKVSEKGGVSSLSTSKEDDHDVGLTTNRRKKRSESQGGRAKRLKIFLNNENKIKYPKTLPLRPYRTRRTVVTSCWQRFS